MLTGDIVLNGKIWWKRREILSHVPGGLGRKNRTSAPGGSPLRPSAASEQASGAFAVSAKREGAKKGILAQIESRGAQNARERRQELLEALEENGRALSFFAKQETAGCREME